MGERERERGLYHAIRHGTCHVVWAREMACDPGPWRLVEDAWQHSHPCRKHVVKNS